MLQPMDRRPQEPSKLEIFGDISRLSRQIAKGGGTQAQGAAYDLI